MLKIITAAALAVALGCGTALAQSAPPIPRVTGTVTAISDSEISLKQAGGASTTLALLPGWKVIVSTPVDLRAIKPGSYIGTTNYAKPDGTGRSLEVHVSPPGVGGPGVDFVMDAKAGTTMTNGVVGRIVEGKGERVATVNYGSGERTITVPEGVPVVLNTPGDRSQVKPGIMAKVSTFQRAGSPPLQIVAIGKGVAP